MKQSLLYFQSSSLIMAWERQQKRPKSLGILSLTWKTRVNPQFVIGPVLTTVAIWGVTAMGEESSLSVSPIPL